MTWAAIVLAGGASRRLGGGDKTALDLGGRTVLDRVLTGLAEAASVVVVGAEVQGGPVAALAAGMGRLDGLEEVVLTIAGDQPFVGGAAPALLGALTAPPPNADVAVLVRDGRRHYLAAAWRRTALEAALQRLGDPTDAAVRRLFEDAAVIEVEDPAGWSDDIDTPEALAAARRRQG